MQIIEENIPVLKETVTRLLMGACTQISTVKPSEWAEKRVNITEGRFKGPLRYSLTPYTREVVDRFAPSDPARWVAVKKGGQVGFSSTVIMPFIGYMIENNPGNTVLTVAGPGLVEEATKKLDLLIENSGIRPLIRPSVMRNKNQKTGDTNTKKEYVGGSTLITTPNNHKQVRQYDFQNMLLDDWEAAKSASKQSGSTRKLWEQRAASYADIHKILFCSTPEVKAHSNIQEVYELGDQRKYMIPCPSCGAFITLEWEVLDAEDKKIAGIVWEYDKKNKVVPGSVRYKCQECFGEFDDSRKDEWLNKGYWQPTAEPSREGFYSYYISCLYSPTGMYSWEHYTIGYVEANPVGQPRKEADHQTWMNLCLGEGYDLPGTTPKADKISRNNRPYQIGTLPEKLAIADGNGRIVLITLGADMNGKINGVNGATEDDARLDWQVKAYTESGASYSLAHGSIGTFASANTKAGRENEGKDRVKWTYEHNAPNSVWPEFERVLGMKFVSDMDPNRKRGIMMSTLDSGYGTKFAYAFLNITSHKLLRVIKGNSVKHYLRFQKNEKRLIKGVERDKLYILTVGMYKELLSDNMGLNWHRGEAQPQGFMNFPEPANGLYSLDGFFDHYQSEVRSETAKDNQLFYLWEKKNSAVQNHFWDCDIYNLAAVDIFLLELGQHAGKVVTWQDWCGMCPR